MREKPRQVGLNVGSASIIMLFAVLCLTVLAALSLLSANSQLELANRASDAAAQYYEADARAVDIYNGFLAGDMSQLRSAVADGEEVFEYSVAFGREQSLEVRLSADGRILRWEVTDNSDWTPDDSLELVDIDDFQLSDLEYTE